MRFLTKYSCVYYVYIVFFVLLFLLALMNLLALLDLLAAVCSPFLTYYTRLRPHAMSRAAGARSYFSVALI